jgi:hypothetical protein
MSKDEIKPLFEPDTEVTVGIVVVSESYGDEAEVRHYGQFANFKCKFGEYEKLRANTHRLNSYVRERLGGNAYSHSDVKLVLSVPEDVAFLVTRELLTVLEREEAERKEAAAKAAKTRAKNDSKRKAENEKREREVLERLKRKYERA